MDRRSLLTTATGAAGMLAVGRPAAAAAAGPSPAGPPAHGHERQERPAATFNVISDIQGDLHDLGVAMEDMSTTNPGSAGLAVAGDLTPRGHDFEYAALTAEFRKHTRPSAVAWAIGNHEFYVPKYHDPDTLAQATWPNGTTEDSLFRSFYRFAGRDKVYTEHSFGGIPVLSIGTEKYMHYHDPELRDEVWLSDTQFAWLEDRLAHWARRRRPVMVITHHPLPNTVSGSHNKLYARDYLQAGRLLGILGRHRDAFLFCGHTHWDLALSDWYVRRVVPGTGNLDGFNVLNTGAIQTGYTDDGSGGETAVSGTFNQGLQVSVYRDRVKISARDFATGTWTKQVTIPLNTHL
ncbi:metallophosphoesterase family protein [Streptomyces sp. NPDC015220]|uniref:metallophosphoesterase family protein n=1 Tax=Streptomyces sp. NPDC015220 TaxID=3364947 RepID=UPI0037022572